MHIHGKRWIVLSANLEGRNQLQCRSHGQKYLKSHRELLNICLASVENGIMPSQSNLVKIKRYEQDCKSVLEQFKKERAKPPRNGLTLMKEQFFPVYMVNQYFKG